MATRGTHTAIQPRRALVARGRVFDDQGKCNPSQGRLDRPRLTYDADLKMLRVRLDLKDNLPFWLEIDIPKEHLQRLLRTSLDEEEQS